MKNAKLIGAFAMVRERRAWVSLSLSPSLSLSFLPSFFMTGSHRPAAQADFEFTLLLHEPPECQDFRCVAPV
jgi:hypothetical protein